VRWLADETVEPETLAGLIEFFRVFADRCHHTKEEDLLFPLLETKGLRGPLGVMLSEHSAGRRLIQELSEFADAYGNGAREAGPRWAAAARDYTALLREHIDKENNVLFQIAETVLTEAEQRDLVKAFDRLEEEKLGAGTHERLHALMDDLTAKVFSGQVANR